MFRRILNLEEFFKDHRSTCYLLVDVTKYKNVRDVENHIKNLFSINNPIYLSENDVSLPSFEDVRLLTLSSDIIRVRKLVDTTSNTILSNARLNESPVNTSTITVESDENERVSISHSRHKEKKRKKREAHGESLAYTECDVLSISDEINKTVKIKKSKKPKTVCGINGHNSDIETHISDTILVVDGNDKNLKSTINYEKNALESVLLHKHKAESVHIGNDAHHSINNSINENNEVDNLLICNENVKDNDEIIKNNNYELGNNHKSIDVTSKPRHRTRIRRRHRKKNSVTLDLVKENTTTQSPIFVERNTSEIKDNLPKHIFFNDSDVENSELYNAVCKSKLVHTNGHVAETVYPQEKMEENFNKSFSSNNSCELAKKNDNSMDCSDIPFELGKAGSENKITNESEHSQLLSDYNIERISVDQNNSIQNETEIKSENPVWFNELMKVKETSKSSKPPLFKRTRNSYTKVPEIQNNGKASTSSVKVHNIINEIPNVNHTLAVDDITEFKILFLSENYTPTVSDSVIGRVITVTDTQVKLKILCGKEICKPLCGKFSLSIDYENENGEASEEGDDDIIELFTKDLINPRKVNPFEMFNCSSTAILKS